MGLLMPAPSRRPLSNSSRRPLPAACTQALNAFPRDFACNSLNVSCRDHRVCNQPGTAGTTLLPITLGTKPPAAPSGRLWTRFYCHQRFVQEQQYPPEGAVLSSEIAALRLRRRLGAKDAFAAPRPHTWSASESLPALPKSDRRRRGQASQGPCNF